MALVTLCPGCGTTFRVNAAQLQAHGGDVRCGQCQRVFNGFATLITVHESAIEYPPPQPQYDIQAGQAELPGSRALTAQVNNGMDQPVLSDGEQETAESPVDLFDEEPVKKSSGWWGLANVLLLLLLLGQIAYAYRTELTIIAPETRPYWERYCAFIGCQVPYAQDIQQLGIESSDLQKNPAHQPEVITMRAIISNHASFPQAFPALQLLLLDAQEQVIASRIFSAQDYLLEDDKTLPFIAPRHEMDIRLDFDSSQLNALGYRLLLLYP
ncbi:MAG: zinc-ribbon and DUF3426 domain-containing protein [Nitrosomonas sp.]|nr:MAG: zinc-ribbon and DUF3426 domain-containing protein [Nitrosomonas sp.]